MVWYVFFIRVSPFLLMSSSLCHICLSSASPNLSLCRYGLILDFFLNKCQRFSIQLVNWSLPSQRRTLPLLSGRKVVADWVSVKILEVGCFTVCAVHHLFSIWIYQKIQKIKIKMISRIYSDVSQLFYKKTNEKSKVRLGP